MSAMAAYQRARRAFWICLLTAVLLTGALGAVVRSSPGLLTAVAFGVLGILLVAAVSLAVRLLLALTGRLPARGAGDRRGPAGPGSLV